MANTFALPEDAASGSPTGNPVQSDAAGNGPRNAFALPEEASGKPAPKGALNYLDDAVRSIAKGATFGFADELAAGANTLVGKIPGIGDGKSYEENLAAERAQDAQIPTAIKIPGEVAGAVGSTIAAAPAAGAVAATKAVAPAFQALAKLPTTIRAIIGGGVGGAAFGAGDAEGDLTDRAKGAATGAAVGGAAGGVLAGVVAPVAGALATGVRSALNPTKQAARDIGRALERDAMTPEQLAAGALDAQATRPGVATIADAGGPNVQGLVERVANTPGGGRSQVVPMLTERQQQQSARLTSDLAALTGTRESALEATNRTMAERATAAAPLYQRALSEGDNAIFTPELERLTSSPTVKSAMAGAVRVWRDNAIADGYGAMNPGAMVDRGGILNMNGGNLPAFPNLQFWDYTKRILDDKVRAAVLAGQDGKVRTLTRLTDQLRTELDNAVPSYRAAREAWGGPSQYMDAIEEGGRLSLPSVGADQVRALVRDMTPAQREGYVTGALSSMFRAMGNRDGAELADMTKFFRTSEMRQKIEALMPTPEAAAEWTKRLDFEVAGSRMTGRVLGNSRTALRQAEQEDHAGLAIDMVASALHGAPPVSLGLKLLKMVPEKILDTVKSRSDRVVADVLANPRAASAEDLNRVLQMARDQMTGPRASLPSSAGANAATGTELELTK